MRIEVDDNLDKKLDSIKSKQYIYAKGNSETVRFLIQFYEDHKSLETLIEQKFDNVEKLLESSILKAFRSVINNILGKQ